MIGHWRCYETSWFSRGFGRRRRARALRIFVALATVVFCAACQEEIVHDLSEREANKVVSHLSVAHLGASKVLQADGRWAIAVDRDEIVSALSLLDTQRVLAPRGGDSLVGKSSMIPSREEQRFRYERALAASIEDSLSAIPGVLEPRVHINVPDQDPLFPSQDLRLGSGSVLLVVDESFKASDDEISALIAGAAGISREAVRVLKSIAPPPRSPLGPDATLIAVRREEMHSTSTPPWAVGAAIAGGVLCALGIRRLATRRMKRSTFSLPKELDFEG